jgi:hypothetical protein
VASAAARRLTHAHRVAQGHLGLQTIARMRLLWPLLDPNKLDTTFDRWLLAAVPVVQAQRSISARLAANYLATFKVLELGVGARIAPVLEETVDPTALATSLLVTGPVSIKRAMMRSLAIDQAVDIAEASSSAAAMRHVLDGGRDTILSTGKADRDATGYERVTSGKACDYCSEREGIRFDDDVVFRPHDGCQCTAEPVYDFSAHQRASRSA